MTPRGKVKMHFRKDLELVCYIQKEATALFNPWKGLKGNTFESNLQRNEKTNSTPTILA